MEFGQTPKQLFTKPHPQRLKLGDKSPKKDGEYYNCSEFCLQVNSIILRDLTKKKCRINL